MLSKYILHKTSEDTTDFSVSGLKESVKAQSNPIDYYWLKILNVHKIMNAATFDCLYMCLRLSQMIEKINLKLSKDQLLLYTTKKNKRQGYQAENLLTSRPSNWSVNGFFVWATQGSYSYTRERTRSITATWWCLIDFILYIDSG